MANNVEISKSSRSVIHFGKKTPIKLWKSLGSMWMVELQILQMCDLMDANKNGGIQSVMTHRSYTYRSYSPRCRHLTVVFPNTWLCACRCHVNSTSFFVSLFVWLLDKKQPITPNRKMLQSKWKSFLTPKGKKTNSFGLKSCCVYCWVIKTNSKLKA